MSLAPRSAQYRASTSPRPCKMQNLASQWQNTRAVCTHPGLIRVGAWPQGATFQPTEKRKWWVAAALGSRVGEGAAPGAQRTWLAPTIQTTLSLKASGGGRRWESSRRSASALHMPASRPGQCLRNRTECFACWEHASHLMNLMSVYAK
jgi:hypothetical protein